MAFVPEGQADSSQARSASAVGHLERVTRGDYAPKVATGLSPGLSPGFSPGFQPWEPSK
jgi:hypothetical protein